jgi:hypothetical protein
MNKLTLLCLFGTLICGYSFANNPEDNKTIPYQKSEFSIPDNYKNIIYNYPRKWQRLSGYEYSALHWEQFVVVFINNKTEVYSNNHSEFLRIYEEDLDPEEDEINYKKYEVGTIILKESFLNKDSRPTTPLLLSGMIKRKPGYDPEFGDWEYFQSSPDGKIIAMGNSKDKEIEATCVSCHSNINDQDFVFATHYVVSPH